MKAKLIVEGREFPIEIQDPELQKLLAPKKKTGYERVELGQYYYTDAATNAGDAKELNDDMDDRLYAGADYYSDKTVAENNCRADRLMRQIRRFAVEHRKTELNWNDRNQEKYCIIYAHYSNDLAVVTEVSIQRFGGIYFDSHEVASLAAKTFHDELIWYFTEYRDSL